MVDAAVGEPHPVGVVQRPGAAHRLGERRGIGEVQRPDLDAARQAGLRDSAGMAGERAHPPARCLQLLRDGRAGVAERPGHHVEAGHRGESSAATSSVRVRPSGASRVAVAYPSPRVAPWLTITTGRCSPAACLTYRNPDITVSEDPRTTRALDRSTIA